MSRSRWYARSLMLGSALYAFGAFVPQGYAQFTTTITPDGTLGSTVARSGNVFNINDGTIRGTNQFHSFGLFSVGTGDIASFNGPAAIQNIVSRVTGGAGSAIDGTLRSTISGANLFLLNPAGILFGPNAQLSTSGSFHASTADYVKLGTDGILYADPAKASVLTSAAPSAFGFLTSNPAAITAQAGVFNFTTARFTSLMQVASGKTLSLVGGPVNVGAASGAASGGFLFAPGGRINLVSVASAGEAPFDGTGFTVASFPQLGAINIKGNSIIDGKNVFIRGGQLTIDGASVFPGFFFLTGAPTAPNGGEVNISVSGNVDIIGRPAVLAASGIQTFAGSTSGVLAGDVPNITINSSSLSVSGPALVQTTRQGPGNPSNMLIQADTVNISNGATVGLRNLFQGAGGSLTINARDVTLDSAGNTGVTGLAAQANFHPAYGRTGVPFLASLQLADSGSITVNATSKLTVRGRAQISTDSFGFGKGGNITINAGDMVLTGAGTNTASIASQSIVGQSGDVTINALGSIDMQNGFRISANTLGSGDGGQANIRAGGPITMTGDSTVISSATDQPLDTDLSGANSFTSKFQSFLNLPNSNYSTLRSTLGVAPATGDFMQVLAKLNTIKDTSGNPLAAVTDFTPGTGGRVSITTPVLTANAGARIETATAWDGNAGGIVANVGSLFLQDGAVMSSRSGAVRLDRGFTVGKGNAGTVNVAATDTIEISGRSQTSGAGSSVSTSTSGAGNGGDVLLNSAGSVRISNSGQVTADSLSGSGLAGNITITAGDQIVMDQGSVSTRAVTSDGGNIILNAPNLIELTNSQVTTSVESGVGGGGNISIDPQAVILNNSQILANAFGGPGGNIKITADVFLVNSGGMLPTSLAGIVDASSALSTPGTVNIEATFTNVTGTVTLLPETPLKATELLRASCAARFAGGKASSLVLGGRDGLPIQPGGLLPSPIYLASDTATPTASNGFTAQDLKAGFSLLGSKNRVESQYSLLPNAKCAL